HEPAKARIAREDDGAHAAVTERANDFVLLNARPWRAQRERLGRLGQIAVRSNRRGLGVLVVEAPARILGWGRRPPPPRLGCGDRGLGRGAVGRHAAVYDGQHYPTLPIASGAIRRLSLSPNPDAVRAEWKALLQRSRLGHLSECRCLER